MQSNRKPLYYDSLFPKYYENEGVPFVSTAEIYRLYEQQLSDSPDLLNIELYSHINGDLTIYLGIRNHLQYPTIQKIINNLNLKEVNSTNHLIRVIFNLKRQTKAELDYSYNQIFLQFYKNKSINKQVQDYFNNALSEYYLDFENGFPGDALFKRQGLPLKHMKRDESFKQEDKKLYEAVLKVQRKKVWTILKKGHDPNAVWGNLTMLTLAITASSSRTKNLKKILDIIILLIQYGADPNYKAALGKTSEEVAVDDCLDEYNGKNQKFLFQAIRLFKASKYAKPHIKVDENCQSKIAKLIRQGNFFLADKQARNSTIYGVKAFESNIPMQYIKAKDGKVILATVKSEQSLNSFEKTQMYHLFKKYYPWQAHLKESELPEYFEKNFIQSNNQIFFDLLWMNNTLVGFNIAEIDKKNVASKEIICHRIKLALGSPALKDYVRLMSLISFQRGFVLQKENLQARVITAFEAASEFSFMQVRELDCFPIFLHDFLKLVKTFYAAEDVQSINDRYYLQDELAYSVSLKKEPFWLTSAELALKFFNEFLKLPEKSLIVAFDNNENNLQKLAEAIDPHLDKMTFKSIIDDQVNHVKYLKASL